MSQWLDLLHIGQMDLDSVTLYSGLLFRGAEQDLKQPVWEAKKKEEEEKKKTEYTQSICAFKRLCFLSFPENCLTGAGWASPVRRAENKSGAAQKGPICLLGEQN